MIFAVDPGSTESAFVVLDRAGTVARFGKHRNEELRKYLTDWSQACPGTHLAIEMIASYGMPVGAEVFDTCVWIGRLIECWDGTFSRVYRKDVKMHLCGQTKAKDANIRQALIDRYGPGKGKAIGTKYARGPLYGISADVWAALAVAVTYADSRDRHLSDLVAKVAKYGATPNRARIHPRRCTPELIEVLKRHGLEVFLDDGTKVDLITVEHHDPGDEDGAQ